MKATHPFLRALFCASQRWRLNTAFAELRVYRDALLMDDPRSVPAGDHAGDIKVCTCTRTHTQTQTHARTHTGIHICIHSSTQRFSHVTYTFHLVHNVLTKLPNGNDTDRSKHDPYFSHNTDQSLMGSTPPPPSTGE